MSKLKDMRESKGLSQAQLAKKARISLQRLQHYEQGFRNINKAEVMVVLRIADALGCDIRDILNKET